MVGTLMNYDPIPTTSKQAAMAMTLANAGKSEVMEVSKVTEVTEVTEDTIETPSKAKKLKIDDEVTEEHKVADEQDFNAKLTQGETSNVKDGHMLFLLREQQLAMERQRFFFKKQ